MPQTQIIFTTENLMESVQIVAGLLDELRLHKIRHYFPFSENDIKSNPLCESVATQIQIDSQKIDIKKRERNWSTYG